MPEGDQQRVAGWVSVALQGRQGLLSAATRTSVDLDEDGQVTVAWRSGPTAPTAARALVSAAASTDLPVTDTTSTGSGSRRADLTVGDVPVVLIAAAPDPDAHRRDPDEPDAGFAWPNPLVEAGVALHHVLWTSPPDTETGSAIVVELPADLLLQQRWCEPGLLVLHTDHQPEECAPAEQRRAHRQYREVADLLLRPARPDETHAEAWLTRLCRTPTGISSAVLFPSRQAGIGPVCLMRVLSRRVGLHIEVTPDARAGGAGPTSLLPAAILSALSDSPDASVPSVLALRRFGDEYSERIYRLQVTNLPPARAVRSTLPRSVVVWGDGE